MSLLTLLVLAATVGESSEVSAASGPSRDVAASAAQVQAAADASMTPAARPYSVPWQLRVAVPVRAVRLDNSLDLYGTGSAVDVLILNAVWNFGPHFYALGRFGATFNATTPANAANAATNLMLGGAYLHAFGDFRLAAFLGATLPTASGGGNDSPTSMRAANAAAGLARNSMDSALFAANDLAAIAGVDFAFVKRGFTAQLEVNANQLFRVRGEAVQPDATKTNLTSGLHAGYFITPQLSLSAELRYQRWLSTPVAVSKNEAWRQNLNVGVGARMHFLLAKAFVLRPGVSYSRSLLATDVYAQDVVQLDFLFCFL